MDKRVNFLLSKRLGQLTLFVIVALVIIGAIGGYFLFKSKFIQTEIPANILPVYEQYQSCVENSAIIGAKEMAIQGYPIIFHILASFLRIFNETGSLDKSCLYAYAELLCHIDDTNIIYRKDLSGLNYAQQQAKKILLIDCLEERHRYGLSVHQLFSEHQISPGGVGDLIAMLLFVGQLFSEKLRCHS